MLSWGRLSGKDSRRRHQVRKGKRLLSSRFERPVPQQKQRVSALFVHVPALSTSGVPPTGAVFPLSGPLDENRALPQNLGGENAQHGTRTRRLALSQSHATQTINKVRRQRQEHRRPKALRLKALRLKALSL